MRKLVLITIRAALFVLAFAQKGTTNYLDEKNGFKCFTLATPISDYLDKVEPVKDDPGIYSVKDSTLLHIGDDIVLSHIFIKTFNDSIYSISLMAKPQYKLPIRRVFVAAYGVWSYQPNKYIERMYWMSEKRKVELLYDGSGVQWCIATFKDVELDIRKGKADNQRSKDAADDL